MVAPASGNAQEPRKRGRPYSTPSKDPAQNERRQRERLAQRNSRKMRNYALVEKDNEIERLHDVIGELTHIFIDYNDAVFAHQCIKVQPQLARALKHYADEFLHTVQKTLTSHTETQTLDSFSDDDHDNSYQDDLTSVADSVTIDERVFRGSDTSSVTRIASSPSSSQGVLQTYVQRFKSETSKSVSIPSEISPESKTAAQSFYFLKSMPWTTPIDYTLPSSSYFSTDSTALRTQDPTAHYTAEPDSFAAFLYWQCYESVLAEFNAPFGMSKARKRVFCELTSEVEPMEVTTTRLHKLIAWGLRLKNEFVEADNNFSSWLSETSFAQERAQLFFVGEKVQALLKERSLQNEYFDSRSIEDYLENHWLISVNAVTASSKPALVGKKLIGSFGRPHDQSPALVDSMDELPRTDPADYEASLPLINYSRRDGLVGRIRRASTNFRPTFDPTECVSSDEEMGEDHDDGSSPSPAYSAFAPRAVSQTPSTNPSWTHFSACMTIRPFEVDVRLLTARLGRISLVWGCGPGFARRMVDHTVQAFLFEVAR